jgi:hypothetical protein
VAAKDAERRANLRAAARLEDDAAMGARDAAARDAETAALRRTHEARMATLRREQEAEEAAAAAAVAAASARAAAARNEAAALEAVRREHEATSKALKTGLENDAAAAERSVRVGLAELGSGSRAAALINAAAPPARGDAFKKGEPAAPALAEGGSFFSLEAAHAEHSRLKQVRAFLRAQARMIKSRQAQLHADQQAWKRSMRALTTAAHGGPEHERMHAIMRKLRHTLERQASTLNDDTEHLQSCFLWMRQLEAAAKAHVANAAAAGKPGSGAADELDDDDLDEADALLRGGALADLEGEAEMASYGFAMPPSHLATGAHPAASAFAAAPLAIAHQQQQQQHRYRSPRQRSSARDLPRHASFETVRGVAAAQENLRAAQAAAAAASSRHPRSARHHGTADPYMAKEHEMGALLEAHGRWLHSLAREVQPPPPGMPSHAW